MHSTLQSLSVDGHNDFGICLLIVQTIAKATTPVRKYENISHTDFQNAEGQENLQTTPPKGSSAHPKYPCHFANPPPPFAGLGKSPLQPSTDVLLNFDSGSPYTLDLA